MAANSFYAMDEIQSQCIGAPGGAVFSTVMPSVPKVQENAEAAGFTVARVQEEARVPVIGHLEGLCHTYIHAKADPDKAEAIILNAKLRRVGVCDECIEASQTGRQVAFEQLRQTQRPPTVPGHKLVPDAVRERLPFLGGRARLDQLTVDVGRVCPPAQDVAGHPRIPGLAGEGERLSEVRPRGTGIIDSHTATSE